MFNCHYNFPQISARHLALQLLKSLVYLKNPNLTLWADRGPSLAGKAVLLRIWAPFREHSARPAGDLACSICVLRKYQDTLTEGRHQWDNLGGEPPCLPPELVFTFQALWILVLSVEPSFSSHPVAKPELLSTSSLFPMPQGEDDPAFLESALRWPLSGLSSLHLPLCTCCLARLPGSSFSHTLSPLPLPYWDSTFPQNCSSSPYREKEETQWGLRAFSNGSRHTHFPNSTLHRPSGTLCHCLLPGRSAFGSNFIFTKSFRFRLPTIIFKRGYA